MDFIVSKFLHEVHFAEKIILSLNSERLRSLMASSVRCFGTSTTVDPALNMMLEKKLFQFLDIIQRGSPFDRPGKCANSGVFAFTGS